VREIEFGGGGGIQRWMDAWTVITCIFVLQMFLCVYVCMYVGTHVRVCVCMYVCIFFLFAPCFITNSNTTCLERSS